MTDTLSRSRMGARLREQARASDARSSTRRRLHDRLPTATPEARQRIGRWKAKVTAARLAGIISKGADLYLQQILVIPSVARGDWCLYSDAQMAGRLNCRGRTVRRHRNEGEAAGLLEVTGHGKDHKPCSVRPILPDGPVFATPRMASKPASSGQPTRPILSDEEHLLTENPETERLPLTPQAPVPAAVGEGCNQVFKETTPITFPEVWEASGKAGPITHAEIEWGKLPSTDHAAIAAIVRTTGKIGTGQSWVGVWLRQRHFEQVGSPRLATTPALKRVFVRKGTPNGDAWAAHILAKTGKPWTLTNKDDGWYFPSAWPPEPDAG